MALALLIFVIVAGWVFYALWRPFGGKSKASAWSASRNFNGKIFVNQIVTTMDITMRDMIGLIREQLQSGGERKPRVPIQPDKIDMASFLASTTPQLIWLGHSTILMRIDGKTIITDPILSMRASPFSFVGPKRTISRLPITMDELPPIDAVILSHDHYDHLDYATIRTLAKQTTRFFVPLGVAPHLRKWGVSNEQIEELDWWAETAFDNLRFACTPARHFSGRKLGDRNKTLWCSWVITAPSAKVYFSGDSGYGPHFAQIGQKFGPFDLTLMECGQYDRRWSTIHMMPEETVQAHRDLNGKHLFTVHWGAFVLALHPWFDPAKRARKAAQAVGVQLLSSKIGERLPFKNSQAPQVSWWDTPQ